MPIDRKSHFLYDSFMKKIIPLVFICFYGASAYADFLDGFYIGTGISATSGLNLITGYYNRYIVPEWLRHFGLRIDFAATDPVKSAIDSAIDSYMRDGRDVGDGVKIDDGKLDAWHGGILLDYFPFAGAWRVSTGFIMGQSTLDSAIFGTVAQAPSQRFYFYLAGDHYYYNGNTFDGTAKIDWKYSGPYFGTGVDIELGCGFDMYIDAGVILTSQSATMSINVPHQQLYTYNKDTETWVPVEISKLTSDVARAEQEANRKLSDIRVYPMLKLGFLYRF